MLIIELKILATALYICIILFLSNGGLQVHSKVLTGVVPGYLHGQTEGECFEEEAYEFDEGAS